MDVLQLVASVKGRIISPHENGYQVIFSRASSIRGRDFLAVITAQEDCHYKDRIYDSVWIHILARILVTNCKLYFICFKAVLLCKLRSSSEVYLSYFCSKLYDVT